VEVKKVLNTKQQKAIPIILASRTISEGVEKAGIKRETFYAWLKAPEFKTEFTRQRQEIIDLALHELKTSASEAVSVLRELLQAEGA
jgi:phage-related protein